MSFHVGQRVVCIADDWCDFHRLEVDPVRGCVYTIRGIDPPDADFDFVSLRLEEIINPPINGDVNEVGYHADYFRPVRDTDISIFTALLNPAPTKQKERA